MRLVTFVPVAGSERLGVLTAGKVVDLELAGDVYRMEIPGPIPRLPNDMMAFLSQGDSAIKLAGNVEEWANALLEKTGEVTSVSGDLISYEVEKVRLRAPVPRPPKILCLALNYRAHADEANIVMPEKPYVFIKPGILPVVGPNDKVIRPPGSQNFIFEGELAVVIGQHGRFIQKNRAYEIIAGYTIVNDMSARDLGKTNIPGLVDWFQVKAFDTSLPMGPCLVMKDEINDPHDLRLTVRVNGKTAQDASTGEMAFKIPEIIEFISGFVTLEPGDIIATGTPGGSKEALSTGDQVEVEIQNIGILPSIIADR